MKPSISAGTTPTLLLQGIRFRPRRTGDGQNADGRRGVRGSGQQDAKLPDVLDADRHVPEDRPQLDGRKADDALELVAVAQVDGRRFAVLVDLDGKDLFQRDVHLGI